MFLDVTQITLRKSRLCIVRHTGNGTTPVSFTDLIMRHSCLSSVIAANQGLPQSFYTLSAGHRVRNNPCRRLRFVLLNGPLFYIGKRGIKNAVCTVTQCCKQQPQSLRQIIIIANQKSKINRVFLSLTSNTCEAYDQQAADHYLQCPQIGLYVPRYDHVDAQGESYVDVSTNQVSVDTNSIQYSQTS